MKIILKNILKVSIVIFTIPIYYLLSTTYCYAVSDKYVRVAIIQDIPSLDISLNSPYSIIDAKSGKELASGNSLFCSIRGTKSGIMFSAAVYETDRLIIRPSGPQEITVNSRNYRGNIRIINKNNLHLLVVNDIGLEDYVKGILYHEVSHYWPQEILKAQAIVCRSYALYQMGESKAKDFDVTNDIYSQVYGGKTSERLRTNKAVEETKGLVLAFEGKVFPAYFHATCAGHTEDASLLWDINIPPLKGVSCLFCKESPHFNWHQVTALNELRDIFIKAGHKVSGKIQEIKLLGLDKSGRVKNLNIITDKEDFVISAKDFRNLLGPNIIRSTRFDVNVCGNDAVFEGSGWGHGAGLCQWGGYFMAKEGYNYKDILKYYYPQASLEEYETF